jgi:hypothetical protein
MLNANVTKATTELRIKSFFLLLPSDITNYFSLIVHCYCLSLLLSGPFERGGRVGAFSAAAESDASLTCTGGI